LNIYLFFSDDGLSEKYQRSALDVVVLKEHLGKANSYCLFSDFFLCWLMFN